MMNWQANSRNSIFDNSSIEHRISNKEETMSDDLIELEEEEHTSPLTGATFRRILGLLRPHWLWVVGFIITIGLTSALDSLFTYINKQMIDEGMMLGDAATLYRLAGYYAILQIVQAGLVFSFIYLAGVLGERIQYDLRKAMFAHLQDLSLSYYAQTRWGG